MLSTTEQRLDGLEYEQNGMNHTQRASLVLPIPDALMINPIFTCSLPADDEALFSTWSATEEECRRIKEFQGIEPRGPAFGRYLQFCSGEEPSVVLDGFLFLGNILQGSNQSLLERLRIKYIINVGDSDVRDKLCQGRFQVVHIPMEDKIRTNIKQHFGRTNELLHSYHLKNERCLVHCAAGVSRSATIVLAYLMKYHHHTLTEAFRYLIGKRPQIYPNDGFMLQLIRYENELVKSREASQAALSTEVENPIETMQELKKKERV